MKTVLKFFIFSVLFAYFSFAGDIIKRYDIKNGKIVYEISVKSNIMGVKSVTKGIKTTLFDDFGQKELIEEKKKEKTNFNGNIESRNIHTINYLNGSVTYSVDFNNKKIYRAVNPIMALMGGMNGGDIQKISKEAFIKMGAKHIGNEKVLGYNCEVWDLNGIKLWIYKGVNLKMASNVMGVNTLEKATSAKFNINISKNDFKLPNFPIFDEYNNRLNLSLKELEKMDIEDNKKLKKGSESLNKNLQNNDINSMFLSMKNEFLEQEKMMLFAKRCFKKADSLKEANECGHKLDKMTGSQEEDITEWNSQIKSQILKDIEDGLKSMACIRDAKNAQEIQRCMSY